MFASRNKPKRDMSSDAALESLDEFEESPQAPAETQVFDGADAAHEHETYSLRGSAYERGRAGVDAYRAGKYGSSTRNSAHAGVAGVIPATPAAANEHYERSSSRREFLANQRARKKSRKRRMILASIAVVAVLLIGGIGAAWAYLAQLNSNLGEDVDEDLIASLSVIDSPSDPFYMLLIGVDKSEEREATDEYGGAYRTDSIILARIDPQDKEVTLISIPRDTKVTIEGHGTQKINAAYAFGGASGAIEAVSDLAGVSISHYAEIDFDGFKAVVDALGGIEVEVPMEINDDMAGGHVDAGWQTLNGEQALILCRSRHNYDDVGDGDVVRAANQRMVISAIMEKIMSSDVATLTNTINTLSDYITTDYSVTGIIGLAQSMAGIDVSSNVYTAAVPTTSVYEDEIWWEELNEDEWDEMMSRVKQGLPPTEDTVVDEATGATLSSAGDKADSSDSSDTASSVSLSGVKVSVKNGSGINGAAAAAAATLTPQGAVVETGNADDSNYQTTLVVYEDSSDKEEAQAILDLLGTGTLRQNDGTYSYSGDILVVVGADWE